jgi:uncharacterized protein YgiM (DUF1202 family)
MIKRTLLGRRSSHHVVLLGWLLLLTVCSLGCHAEELAQVQIQTSYLDMRSGPASTYPVVYVAAKGEWLTVIKRRTNWFKVQTTKGHEGWISQTDLHTTLSSSGAPVRLADGSFADFAQRDVELSAMAGSFDGVPSLTLLADWVSTENISLGLRLTQAVGSFSENQVAMLQLSHTAFPEWLIAPYVILAAGKIRTVPRGSLVDSGDEARSANVLSIGLGLRYYLSQNFLLKLEYNNLLVKTDRDKNEEVPQWTLGFAIFF